VEGRGGREGGGGEENGRKRRRKGEKGRKRSRPGKAAGSGRRGGRRIGSREEDYGVMVGVGGNGRPCRILMMIAFLEWQFAGH
jgi:hypothetical protein